MIKSLLAALAVSALAVGTVSAQTVSYVPASEGLAGTSPTSFTLTVISPSSLPKNTSAPITVVSFAVGAPSSVSPTAAAKGLSIPSPTLTFTGPSQSKSITVNVTPLATGGTYEYLLEAVGWPVTATNNGMYTTVQDFIASKPVVTVSAPAANDVFFTPAGTFSIDVPVGFTAVTSTPQFPITSVTATLAGPSAAGAVALTNAGTNSTEVVGDAVVPLTKNGAYTVSFTATNAAGTGTASDAFTLEETPQLAPITDEVVWESPLSLGTTFTGGATVPVTFLVDSTTTGKPVLDQNIIVSIFPISTAGYPGVPTVYSYATAPKYAVSSTKAYTVAWPTAVGTGHYRVQVELNVNYLPPATGGTTVILTSLDFYTK